MDRDVNNNEGDFFLLPSCNRISLAYGVSSDQQARRLLGKRPSQLARSQSIGDTLGTGRGTSRELCVDPPRMRLDAAASSRLDREVAPCAPVISTVRADDDETAFLTFRMI